MGTNFYWHDAPCEHCGRFETYHVGKRSGGWSFAFQAYPTELIDAEHPDWGYIRESPFDFPVVSRADWRRVFTDRRGELFDQYRQWVSDPVAWLDTLAAPDAEQVAKEEGMYRSYDRPRVRDQEGFRIMAEDFS
jgi:hypothetical protein